MFVRPLALPTPVVPDEPQGAALITIAGTHLLARSGA
jgi:hypothetical protein